MMNYINLYQPQLIELNLGIKEAIVLDEILKSNSWANSITIEERTFFELRAGKIIDDLPILGITTKAGIIDKIKTLISLGLIERVIQDNKPYDAPTEKTKEYVFAGRPPKVTTNVDTR